MLRTIDGIVKNRFRLTAAHRFSGIRYPLSLRQYILEQGLDCRGPQHSSLPAFVFKDLLRDSLFLMNIYFMVRILLLDQGYHCGRLDMFRMVFTALSANHLTLINFAVFSLFFVLLRMVLLYHAHVSPKGSGGNGRKQDFFLYTTSTWFHDYVAPLLNCPNGNRERSERMNKIISHYQRKYFWLAQLFPVYFEVPKMVDYASAHRYSKMSNMNLEHKMSVLVEYFVIEAAHFFLTSMTSKSTNFFKIFEDKFMKISLFSLFQNFF